MEDCGGNVKWQIGSRRRRPADDERLTWNGQGGDERILERYIEDRPRASSVPRSRRDNLERARGRTETRKETTRMNERRGATREEYTRRGFCYEAATFRRRHIHSDTLLVTLLSAFAFSLSLPLPLSFSFFPSVFLLPSKEPFSLDTPNRTNEGERYKKSI